METKQNEIKEYYETTRPATKTSAKNKLKTGEKLTDDEVEALFG